MTLKTKLEKPSLNSIRYHHFLDPAGTNRERLEGVVNYLTSSWLDWYVANNVNEKKTQDLFDRLKNTEKTEEEVKKWFQERKLFSEKSKKTVPYTISREEAWEKYGIKKSGFPEKGHSLVHVLEQLDKKTDPSIRFTQNFLGEMHPHDCIPAFGGNHIGNLLNPNMIAQCVSPSLSYMENEVVEWLANLVGYDQKDEPTFALVDKELLKELEETKYIPHGNIVSGGTVANLTALLVARNKLLRKEIDEKDYTGVAEKGIKSYCQQESIEDLVVFCSEEAHYSIEKLGGYIGIGDDNVIKVGTDKQGRMRSDLLEEEINNAQSTGKKVVAIVATAGTTGCGAIDPLNEIANIAEKEEIYFHVDAAHGGAYLTSEKMKSKFTGIERADSVTIDGHKMFYTNYSCGGIIFKNKKDPVDLLKQSAPYIFDKSKHYDLGNSTVEGSRGASGTLQLYASITALGKEGYETILNHTIEMTEYLSELIDENPTLEKTHDPEMNLLCFRYVPKGWDKTINRERINQLNKNLNRKIYAEGNFYIGDTKTKISGEEMNVQKAILVHPYIEKETLDDFVKKVEELGQKLVNQYFPEV